MTDDKLRWEAKYASRAPAAVDPASPYIVEALARIGPPRGPCLDLAMGEGRHALAAARTGWHVLGVDIAENAAQRVLATARTERLPVHCVVADAMTFPFRPSSFGLILCSRFLERDLAPRIAAALAPGGHLIFETFTVDQPTLGWGPKNPAYLLKPNELLQLFPALRILDYRDRIDAKHGALASMLAMR